MRTCRPTWWKAIRRSAIRRRTNRSDVFRYAAASADRQVPLSAAHATALLAGSGGASLCAVAFGDGECKFAFGVVAVADVDDRPVVDDGDGVEVGWGLVVAVVVGVGGELVEVGGQPPGSAFLSGSSRR